MHAPWTDVQEAASVVALVGVPYLIFDKRKRLPHIVFDRGGYAGGSFDRDGLKFGQLTFTGTIKNSSLESNVIEKVFLVVWRTKRKMAVRRYGYGGVAIMDVSGEVIGPPMILAARSSQAVTITCEFPLTGSSDAELFTAKKPIPGIPHFSIQRYEYDLAFEDIEGNLFDRHGYPLSRKSIDLRWSIDSAWEKFKDGKPLPLVKHSLRIAWEEVRFTWKKLLRSLVSTPLEK